MHNATTLQQIPQYLVMDKGGWDGSQINSSAPLKRSWDTYAARTEAPSHVGSVPQHQDLYRPYDQSQWKPKQHSQEAQRSPGWESNLQTSLWLQQQHSAGQKGSMVRELHPQSSQNSESAPASSRDDDTTPDPFSAWPKYRGDEVSDMSRDRRNSVPSLISARSGFDSTFVRRGTHGFQSRVRDQQSGNAIPPNHAGIPSFDRSCDKCSRFDLVARDAVTSITNLTTSFMSGSWSEVYNKYREEGVPHHQMPQISNLHRLVDLLEEANKLSQDLLKAGPTYGEDGAQINPSFHRNVPESTSSLQEMRRRFLTDSQEVLEQKRRDSISSEYTAIGLDSQRRISPPHHSTSRVGGGVLPPIHTQTPTHVSLELQVKLPSMNPPPTPSRQLPSPPDPSQPSPPSYNAQSSSSNIYSVTSYPTSAPPPTMNPVSPSPSSQGLNAPPAPAAVAAHTAALQHEVSLKSYALQTLQSEHDKLLAALSRSQTRARTLEDKQAAADNEVNTLSEERLRLMERVTELEAALDEVGKARDEYRTAGVREGRQYVEIVRMASRLESMAVQERKRLKERLAAAKSAGRERKLSSDKDSGEQGPTDPSSSGGDKQPAGAEEADPVTNPSGQGHMMRDTDSASYLRELEEEVQQLRMSCEAYEGALRTIKSQTSRIDEVIDSVAGARASLARAFEGLTGGSGSGSGSGSGGGNDKCD